MNKFIILILTSFALVGCNNMSNQDAGVLTGATVGAIIGSQVGSGGAKTATTIGGSILGAYIGGSIGRNMDETDRQNIYSALEVTPTAQTTTWTNPDTKTRYEVTPEKTYYQRSGRERQPCREYVTTATIGGRTQQVYGTACRQADGSWKAVS